MIHFVRAPDRVAAEQFASFLVGQAGPLCLSSRAVPGDAAMPAWRVETIDCCGEALSSARPISMMNWRPPRR